MTMAGREAPLHSRPSCSTPKSRPASATTMARSTRPKRRARWSRGVPGGAEVTWSASQLHRPHNARGSHNTRSSAWRPRDHPRSPVVITLVLALCASRHPDVEPTKAPPGNGGNEQQRPTVERDIRVKLSEPGVHRCAHIHGCGPGIVDVLASGNPDVEAWLAVVGYAARTARVEEDFAAIPANRGVVVLDAGVEFGNRLRWP